MDMNGKEKMLLVWLVLVVALGFFLSHFWSFTVCALRNAVAAGMIPVAVAGCLTGITAMPFLL
jgi:hypothetical protein